MTFDVGPLGGRPPSDSYDSENSLKKKKMSPIYGALFGQITRKIKGKGFGTSPKDMDFCTLIESGPLISFLDGKSKASMFSEDTLQIQNLLISPN